MGCPPVTFNYPLWTSQFPEFAAVPQGQGQFYFDLATIIQRNDGTGPVTDSTVQLNLLNLMTSHMATIYSQSQGDPNPGSPKEAASPVGRINSAAEGSVSVQTDYGTAISQQMAFCVQTKYGAMWWALTAQYRTAHYIPGALQPGGLGAGPRLIGFGPRC